MKIFKWVIIIIIPFDLAIGQKLKLVKKLSKLCIDNNDNEKCREVSLFGPIKLPFVWIVLQGLSWKLRANKQNMSGCGFELGPMVAAKKRHQNESKAFTGDFALMLL